MKIIQPKRKNEFTLVIGCGRLGSSVANNLSDHGREVTVLDRDPDSFRRLSPSFSGLFMAGDGEDLGILEEAGIQKAANVLVATNNDHANIMIAQIAREIYHVQHVISRLFDPDRELLYEGFEIETISPVILSVNEANRLLGLPSGGVI